MLRGHVARVAVRWTIGRRLGLPVASVAAEDAARHFGYLSGFIGLDNPTTSRITRDLLGWTPIRPVSSRPSNPPQTASSRFTSRR